jgi:putative Ca2+/H+ antiporter (TMEM165/GDT1 family)
MQPSLFLEVYGAVLLVEVAGDRSFYTTGTLASRFGALPILSGVAVAFMLKMLVAVTFGHALLLLPEPVVRAVSVATLLAAAVALWREGREEEKQEESAPPRTGRMHPTLVAFGAIFFTEWADPGQLAAAAFSARYAAPLTVWAAASAALLTKGVVAVTLGRGLQRVVPGSFLRRCSVGMLLGMALLVVFGVEM